MRMAEARARYAACAPRRGEVLLGWRVRGVAHELLYHALAPALAAAARLAADPRCHELWLYDGQRLYDAAAIARHARPGPADDTARA